jgi:flagellar hook-length control protein FliK
MGRELPRAARTSRSETPEEPPAVNEPNEPITLEIDKDVRNVVSPQRASGQEDLLRLIALLLGEEENDGFLFALRQYITGNLTFTAIIETFPVSVDNGQKVLTLLDYLLPIAQEFAKEELPPELAPLENLMAMMLPRTVETEPALTAEPVRTVEAVPAEPAQTQQTEAPEVLKAETAAAEPKQTQTPQVQTQQPQEQTAAPQPERIETVQIKTPQPERAAVITANTQPDAPIAEIPDTARVTQFNVSQPRQRVNASDTASAVRAALLNGKTSEVSEAAPQTVEIIETEEPEILPEVTAKIETAEEPVAEQKEEKSAAIKTEGTARSAETLQPSETPQAAPVQQNVSAPQTVSAQTEAPPPARQVLAERVIEQITAQASKPLDVSVLQMELHPKFLGRIQLVIEATAEGLSAKLRSDNGATRSLLNEHIAELRNSLKEAGINMKEIEIAEPRVGTQLTDRQPQKSFAEEAAERESGKIGALPSVSGGHRQTAGEPAAAAYSIGRVYEPLGNSSFDYRA